MRRKIKMYNFAFEVEIINEQKVYFNNELIMELDYEVERIKLFDLKEALIAYLAKKSGLVPTLVNI